jgi:hypothetical protein
VLRASRPVAAGEELTISYGPQRGAAPAAARRAALARQYGFACGCAACAVPDAGAEAAAGGLRCGRAGCAGARARGCLMLPLLVDYAGPRLHPKPPALPCPTPSAQGAVVPLPQWAAVLPDLLSDPDPNSSCSPNHAPPRGRCAACGATLAPAAAAAALRRLRDAVADEAAALAALSAACGDAGAAGRSGSGSGAAGGAAHAALRRLAGAVEGLAADLHPLNQGLARSRARLAAAAAEAAGAPAADDAAASWGGGGGCGGGARPQALPPAAWAALAARAAARAAPAPLPPGAARRAALEVAAPAARRAADVAGAHYGAGAPAAAHAQLQAGWLALVLAHGDGPAPDEAVARADIAAACGALQCHFGA